LHASLFCAKTIGLGIVGETFSDWFPTVFLFPHFCEKKEVLRRRMTICARRIRNLITNETANSEETSRLLSPQNGFSGKNFYVRRFHKRRISFPSFREKIFTIFSHKIISFLQSSLSRIN